MNEDNRKELDRGRRVSPRPEPPVFRRRKKDPWRDVEKEEAARFVREWKARLPR